VHKLLFFFSLEGAKIAEPKLEFEGESKQLGLRVASTSVDGVILACVGAVWKEQEKHGYC